VVRPIVPVAFFLLVVAPLSSGAPAHDAADQGVAFGTRFPAAGLSGAIVVAGVGTLPSAAVTAFVESSGGRSGHVVLLVRAGMVSDDVTAVWRGQPASLEVMEISANPEPETLRALSRASGVWIELADDAVARSLAHSADLRRELRGILERGGVIGSGGAAGSILGTGQCAGDEIEPGLGLLPGFIVDVLPVNASARHGESALCLQHGRSGGGLVGLSLDPRTALVVRGRRAHVVGQGRLMVTTPPSGLDPASGRALQPGQIADLVAFSRAAVARMEHPFPPTSGGVPQVESGTLFVGGGGDLPGPVMERFIAACGGPEALIAVIPTAAGGPDPRRAGERDADRLRSFGARRVRVLHAATPSEAEAPEFLEVLREAGGVWFCGGRQWRLVDSYLDTAAQEAMREVLRRGGAICGSSAGASIQAEYLVRGHPLGNDVLMAEGYERGFGFLPGVAIDQHFSQRHRFADMTAIKRAHPQLLGIGIDEGTALVVRGHVMEVVGRNRVAVYDRCGGGRTDAQVFTLLLPGHRYDLELRRPLGRVAE
jgi:cyanophycinase